MPAAPPVPFLPKISLPHARESHEALGSATFEKGFGSAALLESRSAPSVRPDSLNHRPTPVRAKRLRFSRTPHRLAPDDSLAVTRSCPGIFRERLDPAPS